MGAKMMQAAFHAISGMRPNAVGNLDNGQVCGPHVRVSPESVPWPCGYIRMSPQLVFAKVIRLFIWQLYVADCDGRIAGS